MPKPTTKEHSFTNDHIKVEKTLVAYKNEEQNKLKSQYLEELLTMLKPLIISSCRHYFGKVQDDQIQDGYERTIKLINSYDPSYTNVKFLGYMKRMLMCYYWDEKKREQKTFPLLNHETSTTEAVIKERGYETIELMDLLNILTPREKEVIIKVYLQGQKQKTVAKELNLSLPYIKEILQKARQKLRKTISI